ncbi:MAG TPA: HD domain-containing phosphohydrolase [Magnetospirillaceae bacterium]|jgi:putative two-component system response regulator
MSDLEALLRGARILLVDDVPANIEILVETLEGDGYLNIDSTTSPHEGLAKVKARRPDLILLDMRMPEMDGHEFLAQLRKMPDGGRIPVIVITAQTDENTKRRALMAGVRDFINKPFLLWELLHRVRTILELDLSTRRTEQLNAELERRVNERTQELEATRKEVIRRLATAGEFRDNETGQHVVRMSHFTHHLALAAGISEDEAIAIRDAAPLHDIGKIGIPDSILLKPGRLDGEEWTIMKRHAEIGGEILADSGFALLDLARSIALTHHEQWDGSGYPHGLKGDDIPIAGRLTAVADVFDALLSERPYKPRWPIDRAMDFLKDRAGRHFDPRLVILFERELPAILDLKERFRDVEEGDDSATTAAE